MISRVKEILLKQMEMLQEESAKVDASYEKPRDLATMSSAMAELANAYTTVSLAASEIG